MLRPLPDWRRCIVVSSSAAEQLGEENEEQLTGEQHHVWLVVCGVYELDTLLPLILR